MCTDTECERTDTVQCRICLVYVCDDHGGDCLTCGEMGCNDCNGMCESCGIVQCKDRSKCTTGEGPVCNCPESKRGLLEPRTRSQHESKTHREEKKEEKAKKPDTLLDMVKTGKSTKTVDMRRQAQIEARSRRLVLAMKMKAIFMRNKLIKDGVPTKYIVYTAYNATGDTSAGCWFQSQTDLFEMLDDLSPMFSADLGPGDTLYKVTAEDCRTSKYLLKRIMEGSNAAEGLRRLEKMNAV
jgi:hypothetical protein